MILHYQAYLSKSLFFHCIFCKFNINIFSNASLFRKSPIYTMFTLVSETKVILNKHSFPQSIMKFFIDVSIFCSTPSLIVAQLTPIRSNHSNCEPRSKIDWPAPYWTESSQLVKNDGHERPCVTPPGDQLIDCNSGFILPSLAKACVRYRNSLIEGRR
jgi:hypothetical protein